MPDPVRKFVKLLSKVRSGLRKERQISAELHGEVESVVRRIEREDPGMRQRLVEAHGYAVFPAVGRASAVLGASYGLGEVFRHSRVIGYSGIIQLTIGVQLGGQTFTELVIFETPEALARFKQGKLAFAANAAAAVVKAGVAATNDQNGTEVRLYSKGGFQLEAALGGQKFFFKPAALSRSKKIEHIH